MGLRLFLGGRVGAAGHGLPVENFAVYFLCETELGFWRVVVGDVCAFRVVDFARPDA